MSEGGRGSGPDEDDPAGEETVEERAPRGVPRLPGSSPMIAPYDPYRPPAGEASRLSSRDKGASTELPLRSAGSAADDPFLPADDPLNAEAWHLEIDDIVAPDDRGELPTGRDPAAAPRRPRRQPPGSRESREPSPGARRAARRSRTTVTGKPTRGSQPTLTLGVPHALAGSSLVADQAALVLLGINTVSFVAMALFLGVRLGAIGNPAVLRLDAAGNPALWGPPRVLWRLPAMSAFITGIFLAVAWYLHPLDRFAARFALGAAVVAQLVAWVAVFQHVR